MAVTEKAVQYDGIRGASLEFGTLTFDPATLAAAAEAEATVAFDGASVGDLVFVTPRALDAGLVCKGARVTTADVVGLTVANFSTGSVNGGSVTYDFIIVKFGA